MIIGPERWKSTAAGILTRFRNSDKLGTLGRLTVTLKLNKVRTTGTAGLFMACGLVLSSCQTRALATESAGAEAPLITSGTVAGAEGVSIAYDTTGSGDTAIVFVHGWSCDKSYWREQISEFARDYQVIALDLAGHGDSSDSRDQFFMESFGTDVAAVVDHLGAENVVLVGHSMGGYVIIEAAEQLNDRVSGVIGIDTLKNVDKPRFSEAERKEAGAMFQADFAAATDAVVRSGMFTEHSDADLVNEVATDMSRANVRVAMLAFEGMAEADFGAQLAEISNIPVGLINGDFEEMNEDALRVSHPDAPIVYIEKTGHFPMMEAPEAFNAALKEMIEKL